MLAVRGINWHLPSIPLHVFPIALFYRCKYLSSSGFEEEAATYFDSKISTMNGFFFQFHDSSNRFEAQFQKLVLKNRFLLRFRFFSVFFLDVSIGLPIFIAGRGRLSQWFIFLSLSFFFKRPFPLENVIGSTLRDTRALKPFFSLTENSTFTPN